MKIANNILLFFTLIACGYMYSDVADLEKQLTDKLLRQSILLGQYTQTQKCAQEPHIVHEKHLPNGVIIKTYDVKPSSPIYYNFATQLKVEQIKQEIKDASIGTLLTLLLQNEEDIIECRSQLIPHYQKYNNKHFNRCLMVLAGTSMVLSALFYTTRHGLNLPEVRNGETLTAKIFKECTGSLITASAGMLVPTFLIYSPNDKANYFPALIDDSKATIEAIRARLHSLASNTSSIPNEISTHQLAHNTKEQDVQ